MNKKNGTKKINIFLAVILCAVFFLLGILVAQLTRSTPEINSSEDPNISSPELSYWQDDIRYCFAPSTQKIQPLTTITSKTDFDICLAKNEREGFQLLVVSRANDKEIQIAFDDFIDNQGNVLPVKVYEENYTTVADTNSDLSNEFADALIPYTNGSTKTLERYRVIAFYIETVSQSDSPSGSYSSHFTIKTKNEIIADSTVSATVWNFELPQATSIRTAVGLYGADLFALSGQESTWYGSNGPWDNSLTDKQRVLYTQYYNYLVEHKLSPYALPYNVLDEQADAYMSDERVTSFLVPYPSSDAKLKKYYEKISSNPDWAKKALFYPIDEPTGSEAIAEYKTITSRLSRICSGYNLITPFASNKLRTSNQSMLDLQKNNNTSICARMDLLNDDSFLAELNAIRSAKGTSLWAYVCCDPKGAYNNLFIHQDAIVHRELLWQYKNLNLNGFLYWDTTWYDVSNPWISTKTWDSYDCAGDGCLIYPGAYIGFDEPIGTIRLVNLTDGIEDFDYLTLAAAKFGTPWMTEKLNKIIQDLTNYNTDYDVLETVRREIGNALSE